MYLFRTLILYINNFQYNESLLLNELLVFIFLILISIPYIILYFAIVTEKII